MWKMIDGVGYGPLALIAFFMAIAPMGAEPHLIEKLKMLKAGTLTKAIDIFDLLMHATPLLILGIKLVRDYVMKSGGTPG